MTRPTRSAAFFGVYAPGEDVARLTFFGLFALQHRGQESAGIAVADGHTVRMHKQMGLVTQAFTEDVLTGLRGHVAIGHTRYSTTGSSILRNAQPVHHCIVCDEREHKVAVAHNGNLVNTEAVRTAMEGRGIVFDTTSDTEVIARLIGERLAADGLVPAVRYAMQQIQGAYSLTICTETAVVGVRDPYGVRPLCLGILSGDGHYVLASESCALNVVGATFVRELAPGEIVVIDERGVRSAPGVAMERPSLCMLEMIYFARPDSVMYGQSLHAARQRMGRELAREHPIPGGADIVMPIPDSGIPAALGFAEASGIRFGEGVIKSRYIQRTFIQPDQRMRERGVRMKYTPIREALDGKRVVMVDDSIVRGTTTDKTRSDAFGGRSRRGACSDFRAAGAVPLFLRCGFGESGRTDRGPFGCRGNSPLYQCDYSGLSLPRRAGTRRACAEGQFLYGLLHRRLPDSCAERCSAHQVYAGTDRQECEGTLV